MEIVSTVATELALSALSPVFKKLGTYFGGDVTPEEMEHLKVFVLSEILLLIKEGKSDDLVKSLPLFEKLQATALEVDDLLDEYAYKQIKNQVSSFSNNLIKKFIPKFKEMFGCIRPKSSLKINLEKLLMIVDQVEKKHPFITSKTSETQQKYKSPQATTSIPSSPYFGREKQYESIIKLLLDESHADSDRRRNEVPVIAIRGIGGSGKSLTAQRVCKDDRIKNYFDPLIMWVHVTSDFEVERLTKKMVESASNKECPQFTNFDELQKCLIKSLEKQNRFLLVLDDVWCDDKTKWDLLVSPLNEAAKKGSKIIITTRQAGVARIHAGKEKVIDLEELEAEDCWSILKYYAFNDSKEIIEDEGLVNVGNQIISKAKSSPLALRVVGSSLRDTRNVNEWEKILKQNILQETMDLLSFSFQRLPLHLQRCFVYCSLFPKGYTHDEWHLIPLWIAQGYIENTNDELTLEEEGSIYIAELLSYSFFEKNSNDDFVIHDLLHDLAEKVSNKLCHRIEHPRSLNNIPEQCIHLSMYTTTELNNIEISDRSKLRNLRSLIILDDAHSTNIFRNNTDIFQNLCKLRTLYVQFDKNMEVLSNHHIDQLKHLRYLHVEYNKKLPESLTKLYHLQIFNLIVERELIEHAPHNCLKPNALPHGFGNLINLRTLNFLYGGIEVDYLTCNSKAINIEKLKSLQTVPVFRPEKDSVNGMMPLKNLPLSGSLRVYNLENVKSKEDAEKAMLNQKKNLNELTLEWSRTTSSETCEAVLEGLKPHQNIGSLTIRSYQGIKFANWMVRGKWMRLQTLTLSYCRSIREINFLPPGLRELTVEWCDELMRLPPFGNALEELQLKNCPVLKLPSMSNNSISLKYLNIEKCPMLITDEPLLVEEVAEGDIAKCFSKVEILATDEPLLVDVLVQQQAFSSITELRLYNSEPKPFPPFLKHHFHELSSLCSLTLGGFTTLPNLEKLSSLKRLFIGNCPDVKTLSNLPISVKRLHVSAGPKLEVMYSRDGPLHETISHIPKVYFR